MGRRHLTSAITLVVLVGILVLGVLFGVKSLFAPLPGDSKSSANPTPACTTKTVKQGQRIRSTQVQVSVFNGGSRAGLADDTMRMLKARGFTAGEVGNAPPDAKVKVVRILTTEKNDNAARLVARQFGHQVKVTLSTTDLGPGVDVIVGDDFKKLAKAKRSITAQKSSSVCVPIPSTSPSESGSTTTG